MTKLKKTASLIMAVVFCAGTLPPIVFAVGEKTPAAVRQSKPKKKGKPIAPASQKTSAGKKKAAAPIAQYVCPMGDYSGPMTKDGRCPKCGMALQEKN